MKLILVAFVLIGSVLSQDADQCSSQLPLFHGKLGDNWLSFIENSKPTFQIGLKQRKKGAKTETGVVTFNPRKKYAVYVNAKKDLKIKQLTIIAEKITGDENCNMGRFLPFKKGANRLYVSPLSSECNKMVFFQDTTEGKRGVKKVVASWKAPKMNACTKVVLRVEIVGSDDKIYHDDIEDENLNEEGLKYNALTAAFEPAN